MTFRFDTAEDLETPLRELTECERPFLIGVRHHSAALARVVPELLERFRPEVVLIELPPEFSPWLEWLAHPETQAPVALSACLNDGQQISFLPFADFSPELAAIRWAAKHKIPVAAIDSPLASRAERSSNTGPPRGILALMTRRLECRDSGELWERLVESPALGSSAESLRKAALMFGWAIRCNDEEPSEYDRGREHWMRTQIASRAGKRLAAVVGSYHAAALLPTPRLWTEPASKELQPGRPKRSSKSEDAGTDTDVVTAMIPYSFSQLDERSGYPAGIRDPQWQQDMLEATSFDDADHAVARLIVSVCRELRNIGHPMNAADGQEVLRLARDLSVLRGLRSAGRGELIEAIQTGLTRGQLYGLGQAVASAMQKVLIGNRTGVVPDSLPRCGLAPHLENQLKTLRLPGPESFGQESRRLRLDPLRNATDRARVVVLQRMGLCQIPYAKRAEDGAAGDRESLTSVWDIQWEHATAAMIALTGLRGATLEQAAEGLLRSRRLNKPEAEWTNSEFMAIQQAADCGFQDLVKLGVEWLLRDYSKIASLDQLVLGMQFLDRICNGHVAALPRPTDEYRPDFCSAFVPESHWNARALLQATISRASGLVGSDQEADASALAELVNWFEQQNWASFSVAAHDGATSTDEIDPQLIPLAAGRLLFHLREFTANGSSLMQGSSLGCRLIMADVAEDEFATTISSWVDQATDPDLRRTLLKRLRGLLVVIQPRLLSDDGLMNGLESRLQVLSDSEFFERLPSLRGGFDVLSPAVRKQLLREIDARIGTQAGARAGSTYAPVTNLDPLVLKVLFDADRKAWEEVCSLLPEISKFANVDSLSIPTESTAASAMTSPTGKAEHELTLANRWRLVLGVRDESMPPSAQRAARALDELYGQGRGEGSRRSLGGAPGSGGGDEAPWPNTRLWAEELGELFGEHVREEVLGSAVERGRSAALAEINEDSVRPSIELLQTVLSMRGSLPEQQTEKLRRIARRITDELAKELATRLSAALVGLSTPRPTRRPNRRLDLRRTVSANLRTARTNEDGRIQLVPDQLFFRTPSRRTMDWHVIFVVDVSGSMEPSVIYSALTAAIFSALPALSVTFLAFSTEVIDFTNHVEDPLAMLMEVQVGGGTIISMGLAAARARLKVPSRTIVLLVTDFEEGLSVASLMAEVQALVDTGAKVLGLAALADDGKPRYHTGIAAQVAGCGMPVAALSPLELARWVGDQIR